MNNPTNDDFHLQESRPLPNVCCLSQAGGKEADRASINVIVQVLAEVAVTAADEVNRCTA